MFYGAMRGSYSIADQHIFRNAADRFALRRTKNVKTPIQHRRVFWWKMGGLEPSNPLHALRPF
jgi:hypothetical protein